MELTNIGLELIARLEGLKKISQTVESKHYKELVLRAIRLTEIVCFTIFDLTEALERKLQEDSKTFSDFDSSYRKHIEMSATKLEELKNKKPDLLSPTDLSLLKIDSYALEIECSNLDRLATSQSRTGKRIELLFESLRQGALKPKLEDVRSDIFKACIELGAEALTGPVTSIVMKINEIYKKRYHNEKFSVDETDKTLKGLEDYISILVNWNCMAQREIEELEPVI